MLGARLDEMNLQAAIYIDRLQDTDRSAETENPNALHPTRPTEDRVRDGSQAPVYRPNLNGAPTTLNCWQVPTAGSTRRGSQVFHQRAIDLDEELIVWLAAFPDQCEADFRAGDVITHHCGIAGC